MTFRSKVNFLLSADKDNIVAGHSPHSTLLSTAGILICHRTNNWNICTMES